MQLNGFLDKCFPINPDIFIQTDMVLNGFHYSINYLMFVGMIWPKLTKFAMQNQIISHFDGDLSIGRLIANHYGDFVQIDQRGPTLAVKLYYDNSTGCIQLTAHACPFN